MAEKEYIERGEMVRHIRRFYDELSNTDVSPYGGSAAEREKENLRGGMSVALLMEGAAKALPAADVVEVVHASWAKATPYSQEYCTNCGLTPKTVFGILPNYCPNCGAKMDGGK